MMKALVLSGGYGTSLRPLTYSQQKQLIPVANKPVLYYALEAVIAAGIREIGIVVGPNADMVREVVGRVDWGVSIEFIYQPEPKGIAHAVLIAQEFIGSSDFVVYLGDNILKNGIKPHIKRFSSSDASAHILVNRTPDPRNFGVVVFDDKGRVVRLIEKPRRPPSPYALVGVYMFTPDIFWAIEHLEPSWRNELEITEAIQYLVDNGYKVEAFEVEGWWKDTGKVDDLLEANRLVLEALEGGEYHAPKGCTVKGPVAVGKGTVLKGGTQVHGPTIIGNDCVIDGGVIGPYTSIGNKCHLHDVQVRDSIIMDDCTLRGLRSMSHSILGRGVEINLAAPGDVRAVLGDRSLFYGGGGRV